MITSLGIKRLRGIREAQLDGLRPLTIFVGPNGCGKSTVLEAAGVACAGGEAARAFFALAAREWLGIDGMAYWCDAKQGTVVSARFENLPDDGTDIVARVTTSTLRVGGAQEPDLIQVARNEGEKGAFASFSVEVSLEAIRSTGGGMGHLSGYTLVNDDGVAAWARESQRIAPFASLGTFSDRSAGARRRLASPRFSSALRDALSAIKLTPWYDDFVRYLRELRPNLDSVESIAVGDRDEPFIFEKAPRKGYPVAYAGDGFRRALLLAATLAEAKGGVAALDEPEAFAHPTMARVLARLFERALADGTQILISTHSLEFVATVLDELKGDPSQTAVVGLSMKDGALSPLVVAGADAYKRVVELRDDLRL